MFRNRRTGRVDDLSEDSNEQKFGADVDFDSAEPNVVTSHHGGSFMEGWHMPVLDIDFEAHLEPSSTEGHYHLYLDRAMTQESLFKLLDVLAEVGILEPGYVAASKQRGYATARLPWIKKGEPEQPMPTPASQGWPELGFIDETKAPY